jgi:nitrite reductase/ring-hydroxylating ferredoxin subunit
MSLWTFVDLLSQRPNAQLCSPVESPNLARIRYDRPAPFSERTVTPPGKTAPDRAQPVATVRSPDCASEVSALCSHRGAPLADEAVFGETLICAWHRTPLRLSDGTVLRGPPSSAYTADASDAAEGIVVSASGADPPLREGHRMFTDDYSGRPSGWRHDGPALLSRRQVCTTAPQRLQTAYFSGVLDWSAEPSRCQDRRPSCI